jgi:hyperosmotically inducible periplasmic protein
MKPRSTIWNAPRLLPALPAALLALTLVACGDKAPPPKPVALTAPVEQTPAPAQIPAEDPQAAADKALAASVKDALLDAKALNAHDIDVVAKRGVVTLFGTAKTQALRSMAEKVAGRVSGVTLVENKLAVVAGS